jgi:hypothetical protein
VPYNASWHARELPVRCMRLRMELTGGHWIKLINEYITRAAEFTMDGASSSPTINPVLGPIRKQSR